MELYKIFKQHPVVTTDSRNCPKGSIFFALKGDNFNANSFAAGALENGCSYAVIDEKAFAKDERYIVVDDVLGTLQKLANYHREQIGTTIIGITGTNGKTTTKELIASVLKEKYNILYTQGNLNNHIGVPITLLGLKAEHELAIIEMGANHLGEIAFLCDIARPDYGIITNVGKAHLEGFGSFEGVQKTKSELYASVAKTGKHIFLNKGNEYLRKMAKLNGFENPEAEFCYAIGEERNDCDTTGEIKKCDPLLSVEIKTKNQAKFEVNTKLIGSYNTENILAAVTIGKHFGLSEEQIKSGLEKYTPQNNRSQLTITEHNKLVVDAYNANPTSMRAAIENFSIIDAPNKVLILGDMLELGELSQQEHQGIVNLLAEKKLTNVILIGTEFAATQSAFKNFENVSAAKVFLSENPVQDSFVLVKGSRGIKLEQLIPIL